MESTLYLARYDAVLKGAKASDFHFYRISGLEPLLGIIWIGQSARAI